MGRRQRNEPDPFIESLIGFFSFIVEAKRRSGRKYCDLGQELMEPVVERGIRDLEAGLLAYRKRQAEPVGEDD